MSSWLINKKRGKIIHYRMPIYGMAFCYALSWRSRSQLFNVTKNIKDVTCKRCLHSLRIKLNVES